jgi:ATP/maltotriose-dependent transcriptional regulator MalT
MELAERLGQSRGLGAFLRGNLVEPLLRLGRWNEAAGVLEEGLAAEPEGVFLASLLMLRAELAVHRGELDRVSADVERLTRLIGAEDWQYIESIAYISAEAARQRGDLARARGLVAAKLGVARDWTDRYAWPLLWLGLRIEADAPGERVAELVALSEQLPATTARAHGYRALVERERERALGHEADWRPAVEAFRRAGDPHMLAYALLRLAEASADREAAQEAAEHARALGARPLLDELHEVARRARLNLPGDAPAAAGDDPLAAYGLTEREREVLALVAEGRSNSQIGSELFITRKTASVHVSNILAKLGVASRGEAAAALHRQRT